MKDLCGGKTYAANQRCGTSNVVETQCGSSWYDASSQFCQDGTDAVKNLCGGKTYEANQRCGFGNVIETQCGFGWYEYDASLQFCQEGTNEVKDLCGGQSYLATEQCCGTSKYTTSTQFCSSNAIYSKCGGSDYDPASKFCQGSTIKDLCGTETYPATQVCHYGTVKSFFTDTRDDKKYVYVTIGTQTWMAENLNYNADGSRCYGDNTGGDSQNRCGTYGRLYDWNTAMNNAASSSANPSGVQGVCPSGWHLPSDAEWDALIAFVHSDNGLAAYTSGSSTLAGKYLKAESGWNGTLVSDDKYGFSALPGGFSSNGTSFSNVGYTGGWWSTSQYSSSSVFYRYISYNGEDVGWFRNDKGYLYSVRCVQD